MLENRFLYWMDLFYSLFIKVGSNMQSFLLLYMRLTWGHQLVMNGLFLHTDALSLLEIIGGSLLIVGFASRLIAIPIIISTLSALSTVHAENLANLKFITEPLTLVNQEPYPFLVTALLVFIFGPGRVFLDAWIKSWVAKQPRY